MNNQKIVEELCKRGYNTEIATVNKNGVEKIGFRIVSENSNISPIFYTDDLISASDTVSEIAKKIVDVYEKSKGYEKSSQVTSFVDGIKNKEYVLRNLYVGIGKQVSEDVVQKPCNELPGTVQYLYVRGEKSIDESYLSAKIKKVMLDTLQIEESDAWKTAAHNIAAESTIESLGSVIADLAGIDMDDTPAPQNEELFVLSNLSRFYGAAAILNKKMLQKFGKKHNCKQVIVIPSSIHEVLIMPDVGQDMSEITEMVVSVNASTVSPEEQLADKAYRLDIA